VDGDLGPAGGVDDGALGEGSAGDAGEDPDGGAGLGVAVPAPPPNFTPAGPKRFPPPYLATPILSAVTVLPLLSMYVACGALAVISERRDSPHDCCAAA
jgi:hypothetical protein